MNKLNILSNLTKDLIKNNINNNNNNQEIKNIIYNYNNKYDYSNIIYKDNNNNLIRNMKYKYIIKKYINNMLNQKINNHKLNILYSEPIIYYNKDNLYTIILFIYKPYINNININKSQDLLISKLINNICINNIDINNININIKPIILTYDYLNSEIYSKSLSKHISKYPKLDTIKNIKINQKIINKILLKRLLINKLININKLKLTSDIVINNKLIYQYIIGNIWKYKGKNYNSESNARSLKSWTNNKLNISLSQRANHKLFKLNHYLSNISLSQSNQISKNGKFNVKVQLNHF